jgi:lipoyl(octanoyl) transferase
LLQLEQNVKLPFFWYLILSFFLYLKIQFGIFALIMQQVKLLNNVVGNYKSVWDYQEMLLQENVTLKKAVYSNNSIQTLPADVATKHYLILLEHLPVYTFGKSAKPENLLLSEQQCMEKGIEVFNINRGGDITFHGPGQLVGYPILDLEKFFTDIGKYLRLLEDCIIEVIAHYGLVGMRSQGETGVWLDADQPGKERKICAMGVRCSRWITMHGFALNVNTNLNYFNDIIPCGIVGKGVTSIEKELGHKVDIEIIKQQFVSAFEKAFEVEVGE